MQKRRGNKLCLFSGASGAMHLHCSRRSYANLEAHLSNTQLVRKPADSLVTCKTLCRVLNLRGGADREATRRVNGRRLTSAQVVQEMINKEHDFLCERNWLGWPNWNTAVHSFNALEENKSYVTTRSADYAHRIHLNNLRNGVLDLEPIAGSVGFTLFGIAAVVWSLGGIAALVKELRSSK